MVDFNKPLLYGTLEGLESGWDSPGLGIHPGCFTDGPTIGQPFRFVPDVGFPAVTSPVQSVRLLSKGPGFEVWGFRTLNTTYNLRVHLDA